MCFNALFQGNLSCSLCAIINHEEGGLCLVMSFWDSGKPKKPTDIDQWDDIVYGDDDFTTPPQHSPDDIDNVIDDGFFWELNDNLGDDKPSDKKQKGRFTRPQRGTKEPEESKESNPQDDDTFNLDDIGDDEEGFGGDNGSTQSTNAMKYKAIAIAVTTIIILAFGAITIAQKFDDSSNSAGGVETIEPISPSTTSEPEDTETTESESTSESSTTDSSSPKEEVGSSVSSLGKEGGHNSGINAIIGYDNAFYLDRNPDGAWEFNSPNNSMTKDRLEDVILGNGDDKTGVAPGTDYVAIITPKVVGKTYDVELTLTVNGKSYDYTQVIEVEEIDGKFYVKNIKNNT